MLYFSSYTVYIQLGLFQHKSWLGNSLPASFPSVLMSKRFYDIFTREVWLFSRTARLLLKKRLQFSQQVSSYSEASTPGPSMSPPNMFGVVSRLPTILTKIEYPGDIGFQISFGPLTKSASKSATWTYSDVCKKLYVNVASFCPIKFKTSMPPPHGTILRAVAVFKGSTNLYDVVKRCPNPMESSNDGKITTMSEKCS